MFFQQVREAPKQMLADYGMSLPKTKTEAGPVSLDHMMAEVAGAVTHDDARNVAILTAPYISVAVDVGILVVTMVEPAVDEQGD